MRNHKTQTNVFTKSDHTSITILTAALNSTRSKKIAGCEKKLASPSLPRLPIPLLDMHHRRIHIDRHWSLRSLFRVSTSCMGNYYLQYILCLILFKHTMSYTLHIIIPHMQFPMHDLLKLFGDHTAEKELKWPWERFSHHQSPTRFPLECNRKMKIENCVRKEGSRKAIFFLTNVET